MQEKEQLIAEQTSRRDTVPGIELGLAEGLGKVAGRKDKRN